jgi:inorganic pyrophosphatase
LRAWDRRLAPGRQTGSYGRARAKAAEGDALVDLSQIPPGRNPPYEINAVIEVPVGGQPVKYELDKASGAIFVDRFLHTAMTYPGNYGFIPHTLAADGDPMDVMVVGPVPVVPGAVVRARPVGVLLMEDESGVDEKVLAVPTDALHPYYTNVSSYRNLPKILLDQITHFFAHYKDLEPDKWVRVDRWGEAEEAHRLIETAIRQAQE